MPQRTPGVLGLLIPGNEDQFCSPGRSHGQDAGKATCG